MTNDDCRKGEGCFPDLSSSDCGGKYATDVIFHFGASSDCFSQLETSRSWFSVVFIGKGVFNPSPSPPGSGPFYSICGTSFSDVTASCDRICETNVDCAADEVCFGQISSADCNGK